jgi:hypothetical protein
MGDAKGNLVNIEGSPKEVVTESAKGRMYRVGFGSRKMTATPDDKPIKFHSRCAAVDKLIAGSSGKVDRRAMQAWFQDLKGGIAVGKPTIDMMVFDTTAKEAHVSRGPSYGVNWQTFGFA